MKFVNKMCLINGIGGRGASYVFILSIEPWKNSMVDIMGIRLDGRDFKGITSKSSAYSNIEILDPSLRHLYRDMIEAIFVRRNN